MSSERNSLRGVQEGRADERVNSHNPNSYPKDLFHEDRISWHWVDG